MKKLLYTAILACTVIAARSQSEQIFTFNMFNQMNFNPAVAGSKEVLDAGAIYRNQWWSGIDGSPKNVNVYGHMPFAKYTSGIGVNVISDKIGLDRIFSLGLNYAYRIKLNENSKISLGIGGRFENARADWADANEGVNGSDPDVGSSEASNSTFNVGPGAYYYNKKFYLGLSIPRLLANSLYDTKNEFSGKVNTYFLQTGFTLPLSQNVDMLPNVQVRYNPNSPFDFDANLNFLFNDALMLGAMYRFEDSVDGLVVYHFKSGLRLGLAFDYTLSDLQKATTGSFEVMAGYTFPCEDCKIKNLRYF